MLFLSPILGGPELTVPSKSQEHRSPKELKTLCGIVGHSPYQSKVTGREERLPIAISMLAYPGESNVSY